MCLPTRPLRALSGRRTVAARRGTRGRVTAVLLETVKSGGARHKGGAVRLGLWVKRESERREREREREQEEALLALRAARTQLQLGAPHMTRDAAFDGFVEQSQRVAALEADVI